MHHLNEPTTLTVVLGAGVSIFAGFRLLGVARLRGSNGQISLGKEFAGRQVLVEEKEPGVWLVRTAMVVPDNERWLHQPQARKELQRALDWAQRNSPKESDPDAILNRLDDGGARKGKKRSTRSQQ